MTILVSKTPDGWAADCLDCPGGLGGPLDLGEWTTKREAEDAKRAHLAEHRELDARLAPCPTCGRTSPTLATHP